MGREREAGRLTCEGEAGRVDLDADWGDMDDRYADSVGWDEADVWDDECGRGHSGIVDPRRQTRVCPCCGATLFADMTVCYGCLHDLPHAEDDVGTAASDDEVWGELDEVGTRAGHMAVEAPPAQASQRGRVETCGRPEEGGVEDTTRLDVAGSGGERSGRRMLVEAPGITVSCPIPQAGLTIGRDADNDVVVTSSAVSRHHLRLVPSGAGLATYDLGATNPALLNGRPLTGEAGMLPSDVLEIRGANVTIRVCPGA